MTALETLHGRWTGEEEVFATAWTPAGRAEAELVLAEGPGGALIVDYAETRADGAMTGHGVVLGDGWWWFDSYGFVPSAPGTATWSDGELVLERRSERGRNVMVLASDGEVLTMRLAAASGDGELQPLVSGVYRRG
ncbi:MULTISPECIES: DUF1579 domain-containing protein [unclassified Microbacterium]|uniref:DUF1579 domain-containing protein n=1 Tax=unclassified Microbacterium TaxID=2609290 RepID=UPI0012F7EAE5|nr:DUF1579 domain-containing protein [Microbacterium sp. MAH-37]MVQ42447.1 DUF1579 domain-containing protein [Microbacterium sp. MAH-37]